MARSKEETRKAKREFMAKKRAENPEAAKAYQREYHRAHREQGKRNMREYYARRFFWGKAMKLRGEGRGTYKDIASIWKLQRGRCALTGRKLDRSAQLDHILPKARGGLDGADNLQWLCADANLAKRDMTDGEFVDLCDSVMKWIGERINKVNKI